MVSSDCAWGKQRTMLKVYCSLSHIGDWKEERTISAEDKRINWGTSRPLIKLEIVWRLYTHK
jgi:hypothetical protein